MIGVKESFENATGAHLELHLFFRILLLQRREIDRLVQLLRGGGLDLEALGGALLEDPAVKVDASGPCDGQAVDEVAIRGILDDIEAGHLGQRGARAGRCRRQDT